MPTFKPKPTKKIIINKKDAVTLDEKHKEFMNNFMTDECVTIPKLKKYKRKLKRKLDELLEKINIKSSGIRTSCESTDNDNDGENFYDVEECNMKSNTTRSSLILQGESGDNGDGDYSEIMYKLLDDTEDNEYYDDIYNNDDIDTSDLQQQHMNTIVHKLKSQEQQLRIKQADTYDVMGKINTVDNIMELRDNIDNVSKAIRTLKAEKKRYMLDNMNHVFTYFETKKQISTHIDRQNNKKNNDKVSLFFKISNNLPNITNQTLVEHNMESKQNTVNKYLTNVDPSFLNIDTYTYSNDICGTCNKGEMILMEDDGILLCNKCFHSVQYLIDNEKPSYKETPKEVCFYAYKKINHFKEILSQFQGKETTKMPDEVIENIKHQIKKERIDLSSLTYAKTKEILKKLGYNKYYEHITFIKQKLGIQPLTMSPELEETLCNLFIDIQSPYAKCVPDYRVNFLNYYYVLYKLCELLEEFKYLPYIPLLKDKDKLIEQDTIWCQMCKILDWEYIATAT